MATTLKIINSFTAVIDGNTYTGKQGEITSLIADEFDITVTGPAHIVPGSLATANIVTVYDATDDVPIVWDYAFIWTEVVMSIQIIGTTTYAVMRTKAKVPFCLSSQLVLGEDDNVTAITGGAEPSLQVIDSIVLGNYSGGTGKFLAAFFD